MEISKVNIPKAMQDHNALTHVMQKAIWHALWQHKRAGNPIAVWREGKVVWIPADEIVIPEEDEPMAKDISGDS